jgi:hypothetical protein
MKSEHRLTRELGKRGIADGRRVDSGSADPGLAGRRLADPGPADSGLADSGLAGRRLADPDATMTR